MTTELDALNQLAKTILGESAKVTHNPDALTPEQRQAIGEQLGGLTQQIDSIDDQIDLSRPDFHELWAAAKAVCDEGAHPATVARLQEMFAPYAQREELDRKYKPLYSRRDELFEKLNQSPSAYVCVGRHFGTEAETADQIRQALEDVRSGRHDEEIPF